MSRINFVAEQIGNTSLPGVQAIIDRLKSKGTVAPEKLVDNCLDLLGPVDVGSETMKELTDQAKKWGELKWDTAHTSESTKRASELLQLIVATREYQFA